jgi:hypothetical protein
MDEPRSNCGRIKGIGDDGACVHTLSTKERCSQALAVAQVGLVIGRRAIQTQLSTFYMDKH